MAPRCDIGGSITSRRQELAGGYLWSPVAEANGARSQFYDNMREAAPGDLVLSYANGQVGRIGIVADFAISAPKPTEFGSTGCYWQNTGWLLPVQWLSQQIGVAPKALIGRLAGLLPQTYSPTPAATGGGNQKAYLAEVSRSVFDVVLAAAGLRVSDFEMERPTITIADFTAKFDDFLEAQILADQGLDQTTREQLTRARRGQGLFRRRVLSKEAVCRVTGVKTPSLLIASHVKPWRACETVAERLDGFNGLMLTPTRISFLTAGSSDFQMMVPLCFRRASRTKMELSLASTIASGRPPSRSIKQASATSSITGRKCSSPSCSPTYFFRRSADMSTYRPVPGTERPWPPYRTRLRL